MDAFGHQGVGGAEVGGGGGHEISDDDDFDGFGNGNLEHHLIILLTKLLGRVLVMGVG